MPEISGKGSGRARLVEWMFRRRKKSDGSQRRAAGAAGTGIDDKGWRKARVFCATVYEAGMGPASPCSDA